MMFVRRMGMAVLEGIVLMPMRMRLARWIRWTVRVLVMQVVGVGVRMRQRFMEMRVLVVFGDMQPYTDRHQRAGDKNLNCRGLAQYQDRRCRTEERCRREVGAGPRRSEMAQGQDEQGEARPVAQQTYNRRRGNPIRSG